MNVIEMRVELVRRQAQELAVLDGLVERLGQPWPVAGPPPWAAAEAGVVEKPVKQVCGGKRASVGLKPATQVSARPGRRGAALLVERAGPIRQGGSRSEQYQEAERLIALVGKLPEPLTTQGIIGATGASKSQVYGLTWRGGQRGWLRRLGRDSYARTGKYPGTTAGKAEPAKPATAGKATVQRATVPAAPKPEGGKAGALLRAKAEHGEAVQAGKRTLADVLEDQIKFLETECRA